MYTSTKEYVKRKILQLMDQCDITIDDIEIAVAELNPSKRIYKLNFDTHPDPVETEPYNPEIHGW